MKLWTTVDLRKLPHILQNGFIPTGGEIQFSKHAEIVADDALSLKGEVAFIEVDIPDSELDMFFVRCFGSHSDDQTDAESDLNYEEDPERLAKLQSYIQEMEDAESAVDLFRIFGYACLDQKIPPSMLKLLDPATMLEALHSGDSEAVADAVQNTEATAFSSIGPQFWVWLMMLLGEIFGPGYGIEREPQEIPAEEEEAQRLEMMRELVTNRPRKKRKKKQSSKK